jgi:hypothetical protein
MKNNDMIRKLEFFKENKRKIHIKLDNRFYNGIIILLDTQKDLLVLMDARLGEVPILFEEILRVEPYMEDNNG